MNEVPFPRSYWVRPGKLLAGCYPGAPGPREATRKLKGLLDTGIRGIISLMEPNETEVPIEVRLDASNPLIHGDADASGIPVVILRYVLQNVTGKTAEVSVCCVLPHFLKADGTKVVREHSDGGVHGV